MKQRIRTKAPARQDTAARPVTEAQDALPVADRSEPLPAADQQLASAARFGHHAGNVPVRTPVIMHNTSLASTIQRLQVVGRNPDGSERVRFDAVEPKPDAYGTLSNDGYFYIPDTSDNTGLTYTRIPSYQRTPPSAGPGSRGAQQRGDGNLGRSRSGGGPVTYNPSKYFPGAAAIDQGQYAPRPGYSRLISSEDLEEGMTGGLVTLEQKEAAAKGYMSGIATKAKAAVVNLVSGGNGPTGQEELDIRKPLLKREIDPRVTHYIASHKTAGRAEAAGSTAASLATGGITSMVQKGANATAFSGLAGELTAEAVSLADTNAAKAAAAHDQREFDGIKRDDRLVEALAALAKHFGASTVMEGLKAIPFYVGTVIGGLQTANRTIRGLEEFVEEALKTIQDFARAGHPSALKVADLLGIPREVMTAEGGIEVMKMRI